MNLSKSLKLARADVKISDLFPITHLNSPTIFESNAGFLGTVIKVAGIPFDLEDPAHLNHQQFVLHQALLGLDERFILYVTTHRKKSPCILEGNFSSAFARILNDRYHARFKDKSLYVNEIYLTLVLKGDTSTKTASILNWHRKIESRDSRILLLTRTLQQLHANLGSFGAVILGEHDKALGYSELLSFLSIIVNAGQPLPFGLYPNGHIAQYLSRYQILFGEAIQFQGNTNDEVRFGSMLSLKKYPSTTESILFAPLLSLESEWITTHTFAPLPREVSLNKSQQKRAKLISAEDKAQSQIDELANLEDNVARGDIPLGFHQHTLMILAETLPELHESVTVATKQYANLGIALVKETLGLEPAFWSQIPCNHHLITRASLITSLNFADFSALHNHRSGFIDANFLGSAVTMLETTAKTPVYLNYHAEGSKTNPSKGHTAVFGGNNAGKTTLVNFLDAQMGRYHHRSFYIDRDESSKIYILACGQSSYTKIAPGEPIAMNPLRLEETPDNRAFLKTWLGTLVQEPAEESIPSTIAEILSECIDYAYETLSPEFRTLSHISQFLPVNFPRWPHLRQWLKGGEFYWLFDTEEDSLSFDFDKVGFDVTYLMDSVKPHLANPVYLYLVHRMRQCLDGRLTSFVIDEAWQLFASPFWERCLKEWLPTIRKKNGHFIFMTQSAKTVTTSAIHHVVLDNLATMIVFPNPMAERETYVEHLKLTDTEYQAIQKNTPLSRLFLYKQEQDALLCKLDLSTMPEFIRVLSGNTKTVQLLDAIIKEGHQDWLPIFLERSAP